ncbi:helix-turn-helix domain-containing protein [Litchfieldia salsa]|uniref:Transcriptional regulator, contains XRE-family HTH domain n=1 Tax=Litchfieldia salsa TaxID=930152 RepID=A0A1H0VDU5_9BACI|nr:helix-turn-helix transcriptional regulator [Litchfieldia salsa]SDP76600.1 Transcriptional regulator, contains XRE-family HTH domain [Litchfieldia salsa]
MTKQLGERIKELRIDHGMTLKELGHAINFNYSNLSKIERGHRKPTIEFLECLSFFFNIHISYFFDEGIGKRNLCKEEHEWISLSNEMKHQNITIEEVRELVNVLNNSRKISY